MAVYIDTNGVLTPLTTDINLSQSVEIRLQAQIQNLTSCGEVQPQEDVLNSLSPLTLEETNGQIS